MEVSNDKTADKRYAMKLSGAVFFGFIASLIMVIAYYKTGGEILCTAVGNFMSPNLMLVIAFFALCLHSISILFSCLRKTVEKCYFFAAELAALITGAILGLSFYYYTKEFDFSYTPYIWKVLFILLVTFFSFGFLTILPFYLFIKYKITKENFYDKNNIIISTSIFTSAIIVCLFILYGDKIDDIEICPKEESTHLSSRVSGLK